MELGFVKQDVYSGITSFDFFIENSAKPPIKKITIFRN